MLQGESLMAFIPVSDLARAQEFYVTKLGLAVRHADDYGCMLRSNGTTVRLALVEEHAAPPYTVLGWEVTAIDATVDTMTAAGISFHRYAGMGQDEAGIWSAPSGIASPGSPTARATPCRLHRRAEECRRCRPGRYCSPTVETEPSSFVERHPGLQGRTQEAQALADELRRLIRLSVSAAPPHMKRPS